MIHWLFKNHPPKQQWCNHEVNHPGVVHFSSSYVTTAFDKPANHVSMSCINSKHQNHNLWHQRGTCNHKAHHAGMVQWFILAQFSCVTANFDKSADDLCQASYANSKDHEQGPSAMLDNKNGPIGREKLIHCLQKEHFD